MLNPSVSKRVLFDIQSITRPDLTADGVHSADIDCGHRHRACESINPVEAEGPPVGKYRLIGLEVGSGYCETAGIDA
ncbi:hypothetical protein [Bifidobacterium eulemuris]|uniref:hypothetical protein n=1 Tax=Bifidobacterium eulemuris TaxID=1765219 RepID=UPI001B804548|nr:hypothetical protein [Bifidobacterium eulemuris]